MLNPHSLPGRGLRGWVEITDRKLPDDHVIRSRPEQRRKKVRLRGDANARLFALVRDSLGSHSFGSVVMESLRSCLRRGLRPLPIRKGKRASATPLFVKRARSRCNRNSALFLPLSVPLVAGRDYFSGRRQATWLYVCDAGHSAPDLLPPTPSSPEGEPVKRQAPRRRPC